MSRCFVPPSRTDFQTFRLTEADAALLDEACKVRPWVYLRTCGEGADYRVIRAVWALIAERHGFDPATATEHPDGGAQVIARPAGHNRTDGPRPRGMEPSP